MDGWLIKHPASLVSPTQPESTTQPETSVSCIVQTSSSSESSPSKSKKKKQKTRVATKRNHFREEWKSQFVWLEKDNSKQGKKCTICKMPIAGSKTHLVRHARSDLHKRAFDAATTTLKINTFVEPDSEYTSISDAAKKLELRLCLFVAEHNLPFSVLTHLSACLKEDASDSKIIKKMCINRIKAQKIIKCITGPQNETLISQYTKEFYFSLVVDESTDSTMCKNLAVIIRTFDTQSRDRFLALAPVSDSSAEGIFKTIIKVLDDNNVPISNLIAFTADNCSVMMGKNNGVQAKLKERVPKLLVNGCICHNLNLISMEAASQLPTTIDRLIRAINHHFCNSPSRKTDFAKFQISFGAELHTILKYAPTRWLSRQAAIDRIIEQWTALTFYFGLSDFEESYGNESISFIASSLKNSTIKMYFLFLSYILNIVNGINLEMQSEEPRMHIFLPRLTYLFNHVARNFLKKYILDSAKCVNDIDIDFKGNHIPTENVYCGFKCESYYESGSITQNEILEFKSNAKKFYITFCAALLRRIDFGNEILNLLTKFSPEHVLSGETNNIIPLILKIFPEKEFELAETINSEYRALAEHNELKIYAKCSISEFWLNVGQIKNELKEFMFSNIFRIAKGVLSIPHSSANVERIFSIQNLIKTKCRNRLAVGTCSALLQTRDLIKSGNNCCHTFKIDKKLSNQSLSNVTPPEEELLI